MTVAEMPDRMAQHEVVAELADPSSILVALPTLNEAAHITRTLTDLMRDAPQMRQVKIVVADGGSHDSTRRQVTEFARVHPNVVLIDNPDRVQAAAVNRVVREEAAARHEILVRVDAHARYPAGYVLRVADSLIRHQADALATVMDSLGDSCFQRGAAWAMEGRLGSGGAAHRGGRRSGYVAHGHHAGIRLGIWRSLGGYDEAFSTNEDAEFDHRLGLAGGRIWLDSEIRIGYVMRGSLWQLARQYWRYGRGRAQTVRTHRARPALRHLIPPVVFLCHLLALAVGMLWPPMWLLPIAYLLLLLVAGVWIAIKRRSLCGLWAALALCVMHNLWAAGFLLGVMWQGSGRR